MNHLRTFYLLDLADDLIILRDMAWTHRRKESAMIKLAQIDEELLSRVPEGEFITVLGEDGKPVGFEPECYVRLAEAQIELLDAEDQLDRIRFGGI